MIFAFGCILYNWIIINTYSCFCSRRFQTLRGELKEGEKGVEEEKEIDTRVADSSKIDGER